MHSLLVIMAETVGGCVSKKLFVTTCTCTTCGRDYEYTDQDIYYVHTERRYHFDGENHHNVNWGTFCKNELCKHLVIVENAPNQNEYFFTGVIPKDAKRRILERRGSGLYQTVCACALFVPDYRVIKEPWYIKLLFGVVSFRCPTCDKKHYICPDYSTPYQIVKRWKQ